MSGNATKKANLIRELSEGGFEFIGYICWWNVRSVDITQEQFSVMLEEYGISTKYAREHNYRSAFIRALRNLEEKRIIRKVEETSQKLVVQLTTETKVEGDTHAHLEYDPETLVVIDKQRYREWGKFEKALVEGTEDVKKKLIEYFYKEKVRYKSSDITRYLQKILKDNGDIISLRDQGSVYFVPANYETVLDKVRQLVDMVGGGSTLERLPVPNVADSRSMVSNAFSEEADDLLNKMDKEINEVADGKEVTSKWRDNKIDVLDKLKRRIGDYREILNEGREEQLLKGLDRAEKAILGARVLEL